MMRGGDEVAAFFGRRMDGARVAQGDQAGYRKWIPCYLDL